MFAVTPYIAERPMWVEQPNGKVKQEWAPCRVIGITKDDDGDPAFVVEFASSGSVFLAVESEIRRRGDVL
ncbi:hypothetical protein ACFSE1_01120 [Rhizobium helianthi]|uniref:Uncharacterized protein n=1 Tax=Rhizobium helianthi TaxID=1132695 RepID=A0ABW4LY75_9HYPH